MADVRLNNVPFTIRLRRGLRANVYKPDLFYNHAEIPEGEPVYVTDTKNLYIVDSAGVRPVLTVDMIVVHESEIMFHDGEMVTND
jgi:hypothetical protein